MPAQDDTPPIRIPLDALYRFGDRILAYKGRVGARLRLHSFVDEANVPDSMTDKEFVDRVAAGDLQSITPEEAERLKDGRPKRAMAIASDEDVAEALRRQTYVRAWVRAGRPARSKEGLRGLIAPVAAELGEATPPYWRTLARWLESWINYGETLEGLLPGKGGNRKDRLLPEARALLHDTVIETYCVDTRPTAMAVHRAVKTAFDDRNGPFPEEKRWAVPSYEAVLDEIKEIDRFTLEFCRVGRRSAEKKYRPVMSHPELLIHNKVWEVDHTTVDAIVVDDETSMPIGRARVSVALDRATRVCTGITMGFEPASADVALELLGVSVMPKDQLLATVPGLGTWPCFSAPDEIVSDQGGEFKSPSFRQSCLTVGPDVEFTPVLKAWFKARIERFFRTLSRSVFHRVPGTTFSNIFERSKEPIPETVAVCTLSELWEYSLRFIVDIYNRAPHRALGGKSPLQLWNESVAKHGLNPPPSPEKVRLGTARVAWRSIQRYGVEFHYLMFQDPALTVLANRQDCPRKVKVLIDRNDLTRVTVINPFTGEPIVARIQRNQEHLVQGVSLRKHMLAIALQRENPERLAGLAGVEKAYRILDAAMRTKQRKGGLQNAKEAARYWESLTRVRPADEPRITDVEASRRSFVDDVLDEPSTPFPADPRDSHDRPEDAVAVRADEGPSAAVMVPESERAGAKPAAPTPEGEDPKAVEQPPPQTTRGEAAKPPAAKRKSGRRKPNTEGKEANPGSRIADAEDLDDLVADLGLSVSERKEQG